MSAARLFLIFCQINILNITQYRADFLLQLISSLLGVGTALLTLAVVFSYTDTVAGWKPADLVILLGVYLLVYGLIFFMILPSFQRFLTSVYEGTLDFTLIKPEDAQVLVSTQQIDLWKLIDVCLGLGLLLFAVWQMHVSLSLWQVISFVIALLAGLVIVYNFLLILVSAGFWFIKVENVLYVFESMIETGRWPISFYPPWLRVALTLIVPIATAITLPAQSLIGLLTWQALLGTCVAAVIVSLLTRRLWLIGLHHYSSASS